MGKRILGAVLALMALWGVPRLSHPGVDVGKLRPAELVSIIVIEENRVEIVTDTGDFGRGTTLEAAIADLKEGSSGAVFLETADYLVITGQFRDWETLCRFFRPGVRVCAANGVINPEEAASYLRQHPPTATLAWLRVENGTLETLRMEEGRGRLAP